MAAACAAVAREGLTAHVERVCHSVRHTGHSVCTTQPPPPRAISWCGCESSHPAIMLQLALSAPILLLLVSAASQLSLAQVHHGDSSSAPAPAGPALPLPADPEQSCALSVHRNASRCGQANYPQYSGSAESPGALSCLETRRNMHAASSAPPSPAQHAKTITLSSCHKSSSLASEATAA